MGTFADRLARGERPRWIERTEYCGNLLAGGRIPWLNVGAFVSWQRQAESLIRSDVTVLPVAALCDAWLDAHPDLLEAMTQKKRPLHPLKCLLADEALRRHIGECLTALGGDKGARSLVLSVPSPRAWIALSWNRSFAGSSTPEIGLDEIETAAIYVADFLRAFAETPLDAVLLEGTNEATEGTAGCQPLLNLAGHYHWDVGFHLPADRKGATLAGLAFVIAETAVADVPTGLAQSVDFWSGAAAAVCGETGFPYARIPPACAPETVLERLEAL